MTHRSLLDYLGEPAEPESGSQPESYAVDQLQARLAELEARLTRAVRTNAPAENAEPALSSRVESILNRREAVSAERSDRVREPARENVRFVERRPERISVQAPPLAPEAAAASGDFGRFVDAVQLIAQAANRYLQQSTAQPLPVRSETPPRPAPEIMALTESLGQVLGALHEAATGFRSAADEMRRNADTRRLPNERHAATRRVSRDDAELYRLQDDLDELRERLASVTRRRSRNPY